MWTMSEQVDAGRVAATFCATLADEWVRGGVTDAVIAPGSRSTPIALAVARHAGLRIHVVLDERSAAFTALGIGRTTGRPAVVITTSGTAAVELHPAVVEAHHDGVPLICVTADRPPELQDVGAPQTVHQVGLFGGCTRWATAPGPPSFEAAATWRSLGARAVVEAIGGPGRAAGPVHMNLAFREPLLGEPLALPPGRDGGGPWHHRVVVGGRVDDAARATLADLLHGNRGVIVAGAGAGASEAVHRLAAALGWPVLADPRSGVRDASPTTVSYFDQILRMSSFATSMRPAVVLRLGRPPASKVLAQWLAASDPVEVVVDPTGAWIDPDHRTASSLVADPTALCHALAEDVERRAPAGNEHLGRWQQADAAAGAAIAEALDDLDDLSEPAIARAALAAVPSGGSLVVSSSMPVRDVEWFAAPRSEVRVVANRGANGIDGVVSTAVGVALGSRRPTVLLIGDLAYLHDANGLLGLADRPVDLTIVVVDNRGGGIFSFLPQASELPADEFERLFGTPQPTDLVALAEAHGISASRASNEGAIAKAVAAGGVQVLVFETTRTRNVQVHELLTAAVAEAVGR